MHFGGHRTRTPSPLSVVDTVAIPGEDSCFEGADDQVPIRPAVLSRFDKLAGV